MKPEDVETAATGTASASSSSIPTAGNEEPQIGRQTGEPVATQEAGQEQAQPSQAPDYKALYEESEKRRAGLQRKVERLLKGQRSTTRSEGLESFLTGDQDIDSYVVEHPLTRRALEELSQLQLQNGVKELLADFPNVPEEVRKALERNPIGFVSPETTTVTEALQDIETFLLDTYGAESPGGQGTPLPKEFPVAQTNESAAGGRAEVPLEEKSAEELEEMYNRGEITLQDLEAIVKKLPLKKEVKKVV